MTISRISDGQAFTLLRDRAVTLQATLADLQEQVATGKRLTRPDTDPLGAGQIVRANASLAALAQYGRSAQFGIDVLGAQDQALGEAGQIITRADEIATQQANGTLNAEDRAAAAEEVHGLLAAMTSIGNTEFAGRRLFSNLALDAPPPFASPDTPGYDPATVSPYLPPPAGIGTGSTQEFSIKVGGTSAERVRISTNGDTVFTPALAALHDLETALRTNGNVAGTLDALSQARDVLSNERTSVGARQAELTSRSSQTSALTLQEQKTRGRVQDADMIAIISQLTQVQTALQALLQAGAQIAQTSLTNILHL